MSLTLTVAPAVEPVSLTEAKAHCRIDATTEDTLIATLITTSRLQVEAILGFALIQQTWTWRFDAWPDRGVPFPLRPILSVTSVRTQNSDLSFTTVPAANYILDPQGPPPRLIPVNAGFPNPGVAALGIEITFTAGFGPAATDVPAPLRQAILLLVAHWFENREPVLEGAPITRFPDAVIGILEPYRTRRL
jgi:uncharacterized phiE125 gp8 family phage protein